MKIHSLFYFYSILYCFVKCCSVCQLNLDKTQCLNQSYCKWVNSQCQPKSKCSEFTNQTTCYQSQFAGIKCYYQDNQCKGPVSLCTDVQFQEKNFFESFQVCTSLQCWPDPGLTTCINYPLCKSGIYGRCSAYSQIDISSYKIDLCLENPQTGKCNTQSFSILYNLTNNCRIIWDENLCNSVNFCYYDSINNTCLNLDTECTNNPQLQCKPFIKDNLVNYCYYDKNFTQCMKKEIKSLPESDCLAAPNHKTFFFKDGLCQQCQLTPIYSSFQEILLYQMIVILIMLFI